MAIKKKKIAGIKPLENIGVEQISTPQFFEVRREPTTTDRRGYRLVDLWLDVSQSNTWMLLSLTGGSATWIRFGFGDTSLKKFVADVGSATPGAGIFNLIGFQGFNTLASGSTVTLRMDSANDGEVLIGGGIAPSF